MKISRFKISIFFLLAMFVLAPLGAALAHGEPVITVQPSIVPVGGQITITGSDMEAGEIFTITLESATSTIPLGKATASGEGEEAGFVAVFTIPSDVTPGSYIVRATTEEGEIATADLTVTEASTMASAAPAIVQEPTGELHVLERPKPSGQIVAASLIALASLVLGVWLIRRPG